jgi:hypothetical protein
MPPVRCWCDLRFSARVPNDIARHVGNTMGEAVGGDSLRGAEMRIPYCRNVGTEKPEWRSAAPATRRAIHTIGVLLVTFAVITALPSVASAAPAPPVPTESVETYTGSFGKVTASEGGVAADAMPVIACKLQVQDPHNSSHVGGDHQCRCNHRLHRPHCCPAHANDGIVQDFLHSQLSGRGLWVTWIQFGNQQVGHPSQLSYHIVYLWAVLRCRLRNGDCSVGSDPTDRKPEWHGSHRQHYLLAGRH